MYGKLRHCFLRTTTLIGLSTLLSIHIACYHTMHGRQWHFRKGRKLLLCNWNIQGEYSNVTFCNNAWRFSSGWIFLHENLHNCWAINCTTHQYILFFCWNISQVKKLCCFNKESFLISHGKSCAPAQVYKIGAKAELTLFNKCIITLTFPFSLF